MNTYLRLSFLFSICLSTMGYAQTHQQGWRGPNRNGVYDETSLLKEWPAEGPSLVWESETIGKGYSSAVIANSKVYISGMNEDGSKEKLSAFSMDGKLLFQTEYGTPWQKTYPETRTTPTIVGDDVFVISGSGEVICLDANSGTIRWTVNAGEKYQRKIGNWGTSESALVYDNKVIYTPGGDVTTMIALDKSNGELLWQSESLNEETGYVSPLLITHNGKRQIISCTAYWAFGVNPDNGKMEWKTELLAEGKRMDDKGKKGRTIFTNSPIFHDGKIFYTNGYDAGAVLIQLNQDATAVTEVWRSDALDVHHGGAVLVNGMLFGSNWLNNSKGNWCCLDWKTGVLNYEQPWEGKGKGSIISADGMLYCYDERAGFVGLVNPVSEKFDVVSQFKTTKGSGPYWAHLMIHEGRLYVRHGEALMVFALK